MTATEILKHEHKIILKVLDVVRHEAQGISDTGKLNIEKLGQNLGFFPVFFERLPQGKGEEILFPHHGEKGHSC